MSRSILWKLIASAAVFVWALVNLIPYKDTPFEVYIKTRATANKGEFSSIVARAQDSVKAGESPTLFIALKNLGRKEQLDYSKFFKDINLVDVRNLERRNDILLNELLKETQAKLKRGLDLRGGVSFTLQVDPSALQGKQDYEKAAQMNKAIDIMGRRINGLGVVEPIIRVKGGDQIEIQLPGVSTQDNPEVVNALKKPAKLEFRFVHSDSHLRPELMKEEDYPLGYEVLALEREDRKTGEIFETKMFVKRRPAMTGQMIKRAGVSLDPNGGFSVNLGMTDEGSELFRTITRENVGHLLGIVLDGKLYSAPRINGEIPNGNASVTGDFTQREAIELANVLNNPLEFELRLAEMYEVGPSLAEDARTSCIYASIIGAGLVIFFMMAYYLTPGAVAVVSVLFNVFIVLGVLSNIGATMTLPGVAALVLTIGMGVDSNILIFERIREELRAGKSLHTALIAGHERAFATIVDSNLTTVMTAAILIWLGTGPIKGFGVTLAIGIFATMFCALIFSHGVLQLLIDKKRIRSMMTICWFKDTHFDFMKYRKIAFIGSVILMVSGFIAIGIKGKHIYGIDFVGGDDLTVKFEKKISIKHITSMASAQRLGEVVPVYQRHIGEDKEELKIQTEAGRGLEVFSSLQREFPEAQLNLLGINHIGGAVSGSIKGDAFWSIMFSIIGILIYVAFRFEMGYGIGAVVSTVHDIFMTVGLYVLLGGQFSAPMVAAVLMIIGYSINDTIVVFDRIREELQFNPSLKLNQVINLAINRTLSRTLLTSFTTFLSTLALYVFGTGVIVDFALVFLIGIITGTFSSIFIASPVFYWWHKGDRKHVESHEIMPKYEWDAGSSN